MFAFAAVKGHARRLLGQFRRSLIPVDLENEFPVVERFGAAKAAREAVEREASHFFFPSGIVGDIVVNTAGAFDAELLCDDTIVVKALWCSFSQGGQGDGEGK